jgi:hypothetical protein
MNKKRVALCRTVPQHAALQVGIKKLLFIYFFTDLNSAVPWRVPQVQNRSLKLTNVNNGF